MSNVTTDPELKAEWVAALRSGNYAQGRNLLRSKDDEYCCLGVLCDLMAKKGIGQWLPGDDGWSFSYGGSRNTLPPADLARKVFIPIDGDNSGFMIDNPTVRITDGADTSLAEANDDGYTFEEIANLIETQL